jgi:broad specificity phosphatase PhoE
MPTTYLHVARHGQGAHNLPGNFALRDPALTAVGRGECAALRARFPHHARVTHLVASPMRRTIQTCLAAFYPGVEITVQEEQDDDDDGKKKPPLLPGGTYEPPARFRVPRPSSAAAAAAVAAVAPGTGGQILLLPDLQEAWDYPCDTGSDPSTLAAEFNGVPAQDGAPPDDTLAVLDLSRVGPDFLDKSAGSRYDSDWARIEARARDARVLVRELGRRWCAERGTDAHVVIVTHGSYVNWFTDTWGGHDPGRFSAWKTAECRTFAFADASGADPDARLVETDESWATRSGSAPKPTPEQELEFKNKEYPRYKRELEIRLKNPVA